MKRSNSSATTSPRIPLNRIHPVYFHPRPAENLSLVESIDSMNPLMDCKVANLTEEDAPKSTQYVGQGLEVHFER
jgi:splicing factor 3B subunit 3